MLRVVSKNPAAGAFAAALDAAGPLALPPDLGLVFGGDGTMLEAIHDHDGPITWLGLNFGHLGFLMNDLPAHGAVEYVRAALADRSWQKHGFLRLSVRAETRGGPIKRLAVNDCYVERSTGTTIHLRIRVDGRVLADRQVCDGVIAATPLGSTAYSFSAGGAASHPLVRSIHLTAICPHAPKLPPVILPPTARVSIEVLDAARRPARVVVDGVTFDDVSMVELASRAEDDVSLAFFEGHDFTGTLLRKVLRR